MGPLFVHLNYEEPSGAVLQDEYGDTAYYLIPSYPVPLLMPINMIPVVGPIAPTCSIRLSGFSLRRGTTGT